MSGKIGYGYKETPQGYEPLLAENTEPAKVAVVEKILERAARGDGNIRIKDGQLTTTSPAIAFSVQNNLRNALESALGRETREGRPFIITTPTIEKPEGNPDKGKYGVEIFVTNADAAMLKLEKSLER